jgi:hypothetical protein
VTNGGATAVRLRAKQREFEVTTQELLKKTTVVYVESFHKYDKLTKPVLDGLNNTELITTFENAWRKLQEFRKLLIWQNFVEKATTDLTLFR